MRPQEETKILGVIMDSKLRFKNYVKKILTKDLKMVLALKQMRTITSAAAHQLFNTTVAPVIIYILLIWMHTLRPTTTKTIR